jgi:malonyl CoA-acyl carrier protein transacylase
LIAPYCLEYNSFCATGKYNDPDYPIISVYDRRIMTSADDLRQENCINVPSPLRWDLTLCRLEELGVTEFFDMSADCGIKKFSKCECRSAKIFAHIDI